MSGPDPQTYLGDGAYAQWDGYQLRAYTSDGVRETNEVFMEPLVFHKFVMWGCQQLGWKVSLDLSPKPPDEAS